jgi:hypothetical protein
VASAFQSGAFQADAFQFTASGVAVYPDPMYVLIGVTYGPTGEDYVGTYQDPMRINLNTGELMKPIGSKFALPL